MPTGSMPSTLRSTGYGSSDPACSATATINASSTTTVCQRLRKKASQRPVDGAWTLPDVPLARVHATGAVTVSRLLSRAGSDFLGLRVSVDPDGGAWTRVRRQPARSAGRGRPGGNERLARAGTGRNAAADGHEGGGQLEGSIASPVPYRQDRSRRCASGRSYKPRVKGRRPSVCSR